jgi:3-oxoacyl-[acyl-carrier-protein] synthase-3
MRARSRPVAITSIAHYVPPDVLSNSHFEAYLETTDEWIRSRTGIVERRILRNGATSDLLAPAALECLAARGLTAADVDCVIVATITPDRSCPATAAILQHKIGASQAWGFDLAAACCGFLFGAVTAAALVEAGAATRVLLCAGDKMSAITDYDDRHTAVLFGDAGAAALIEASDSPDLGILDYELWMDGKDESLLRVPAGGSACPASADTVAARGHTLHQDGQAVYKAAVGRMSEITTTLLERNRLSIGHLDWFVPHQANSRIVEAVGRRLRVPEAKVMTNVARFGNTSATSVPLCLSEWHQHGRLRLGDKIVLTTFGAGFTAASLYLSWAIPPPMRRPPPIDSPPE